MQPALFWEPLPPNTEHRPPNTVLCKLCPNYCQIPPNQRGKCRKRINIDGRLYTENYGETISLSLDPMRKKPLYHFHPDDMILSLGANSCNLTCQFCQNYTSSQIDCQTQYISPEELLNLCLTSKTKSPNPEHRTPNTEIRHIAFTYTEPFTWFEYIYDCTRLLKQNGVSVVLVTNGYVNPEPLEMLIPYISAMNIDLKAFSDKFYSQQCGGKLQPVLDTIKYCTDKTHIEITLLLIETLNDDPNELDQLFSFIKEISPEIPLHISKYFPRYKLKLPETRNDKVLNAVSQAKKYLKYVYAGNI